MVKIFTQTAQRSKAALLLVVAVFLSSLALGQVTGTIVDDDDGSGIPGATIVVEGSTTGTITDVNGSFSLDAGPDDVLVISYVGYTTQEIAVGSQTAFDVRLALDVKQLQEIVVTGYTSQRKQDITGAVSVVNTEELNRIAAPSFAQKLEGQSTGLTVSTSGEPGQGSNIRIRGISSFNNNDPLYIIDGVPVQDAFNTGFNPNDIESIQVLKDASAASIYGARANNGVIIVTTKQGKAGKISVTYDGYAGVATPINDQDYLISDPKDWSEYQWQRHENAGLAIPAGNPYAEGRQVLPDLVYPYPGPPTGPYSFPDNIIMESNKSGTDWWDETFDPAPITEHNLGVSGGTENSRYYFSTSYFNQQGTMIHNSFQRYSVRANTEFTLGRFTIGENISLTRAEVKGQDEVGGGNQDEQGVMTWLQMVHPLIPVKDTGGNWGGAKAAGMGNASNPVAQLTRGKDNGTDQYRVLGNVYGEVKIIEGLKARTSFGVDYRNSQRLKFFYPVWENSEPNTTNGFEERWENDLTWTWTNTINYNKTFSSVHNLGALVGYEAISREGRNIQGNLNGYVTENINAWYLQTGLADPGTRQVSSDGSINSLASVFGKVDYSYDDRYLVSATVRRDGSSNFGDEKYGTFPAFSLGWRISNEAFMSTTSWLDDLKLRFGYGVTGNQAVPAGNAFDRFGGGTAISFYDITGANNAVVTGYALTDRGNRATQWEENISTNVGVDLAVLDGRLNFVVDIYQRTVDGLLFPAALPGGAGTAAPAFINVAKMENKGIDLSLDWTNQTNSGLKYGVGLLFSSYSNEIVDIDGSSTSFFPTGFDSRIGTVNINEVGSSISSFYGLTADGIFRDQSEVDAHAAQDGKAVGRLRFKDLDGDGFINDNDKGVIGDPHPDFTYALNLNFAYKGFDLVMFFYGVSGAEIFNYNGKMFGTFGFFNANVNKEVLTNSFHPTNNPGGDIPMVDINDIFSLQPSTFYVEKAGYLRAKNIQLGYTFNPTSITSSLRVYIQAQNLFTITDYSGLDPAPSNFGVQDSGQGSTNLNGDLWNGFDFGNYPASKIFMLGVNVGF